MSMEIDELMKKRREVVGAARKKKDRIVTMTNSAPKLAEGGFLIEASNVHRDIADAFRDIFFMDQEVQRLDWMIDMYERLDEHDKRLGSL